MKKILVSILLLTALTQTSKAQIDIRYGVEAGINFSTIGIKVANPYGPGTTSEATTFKRGGKIGGLVEFAFGEHYAAQGGVYVSGKGASGNGITYLEIPLLFVKKFGRGHGFYIDLGPYMGFVMNTNGDVTVGTPDITSDKLGIKSSDFGAKADIGYQLKNGLFFRAGYELGFVNIASTTMNGEQITNDGFSISIGYLFGSRYGFY